jgi:hypothetical protein
MKRISIVLGLAVLMAATVVLTAGAALAQATTETFNVRTYESFIIPEENATCPGQEAIQLDGFFHYVVQVTKVDLPNTQSDTDVYKVTNNTNTTNVIGTGLVSGNEYRFVGTGRLNETLLFPEVTPEGIQYTGIEETSYSIISPGASTNLRVHVTSKIVYDEDQAPLIKIEKATFDCTGAPPTAA